MGVGSPGLSVWPMVLQTQSEHLGLSPRDENLERKASKTPQ